VSNTKKIQAFTMVEMLVVMLLTVIVVSLAVMALNVLQNQLSNIRKNHLKATERETLTQALWVDLHRHEAFVDIAGKTLYFMSPTDTVTYVFANEFVLRNKNRIHVQVAVADFLLDGRKSNGRIDAISLKLSKEFQSREIFVYKQKDAAYYINQ